MIGLEISSGIYQMSKILLGRFLITYLPFTYVKYKYRNVDVVLKYNKHWETPIRVQLVQMNFNKWSVFYSCTRLH